MAVLDRAPGKGIFVFRRRNAVIGFLAADCILGSVTLLKYAR